MWEADVQHGRQAVARSDLKCRADLLTEELQFLRSARPETLGRVVAYDFCCPLPTHCRLTRPEWAFRPSGARTYRNSLG